MTAKEIDERLEESESLKSIAQAYSEIANLKVKRIRASVERNRIFFAEIIKVYETVLKFAMERKINIKKPKSTISLVLTSNHGFYGTINSDLIKFFTSQTKDLNTDRIIINKAGIDFFRSQPVFSSGHSEVLLKEDMPDSAELMNLVNMTKDYSKVLVFHSSMQSLLKQVPTVTDISVGSLDIGQTQEAKVVKNEDFKFIFEPELPKILDFFNNQINTLLLEETFLEAELSRTASRFIAMDEAETASNKSIKEYQMLKAFVKRNAENNTILENFATMMAVRKEEIVKS